MYNNQVNILFHFQNLSEHIKARSLSAQKYVFNTYLRKSNGIASGAIAYSDNQKTLGQEVYFGNQV